MLESLFEQDSDNRKEPEAAGHEVLSVLSPQGSKMNDSDSTGSTIETIRQSGLAYSAAIALAASVVFMLIVGWGADLLFATSPWGIVIGIVIGAGIGFVQFFRINARIFRK